MRNSTICIACLFAFVWLAQAGAQQPTAARATLYEGARLIVGDGNAPIESSAFIVENARFTRVGRRGEVQAPPGAARVDLSGKTVIPALVDGHSHIGYMKNLTSGAVNYTRENILDHMHRFAYFGVAASQSMGSDFGELPFQIRDDILAGKYPDAARFLTAGRGLAPLVEISPDNMRQAAFPVTTPEGARASVQELVPRKVRLIKTWVDDRGGTIKKLTPELYGAIIDEAHKNKLRVAVHATDLRDAKELLRAGIDVFAHMISDTDEELVSLFKQHPNTAVLSALGGPHRAVYAPWLNPVHPLILETVLPEQIKRLQGRFPLTKSRAAQTIAGGVGSTGSRHLTTERCGRKDRRRHRRRRAAGRSVHRLDDARRVGEHGDGGHSSGEGAGRGDTHVSRDPRSRRSGNGCSRQERGLRRPRCEPARRHHEHEEDLERVSARSSNRSRKAASEFRCSSVTTWPIRASFTYASDHDTPRR